VRSYGVADGRRLLGLGGADRRPSANAARGQSARPATGVEPHGHVDQSQKVDDATSPKGHIRMTAVDGDPAVPGPGISAAVDRPRIADDRLGSIRWAAGFLNVEPATLNAWECRFDFPRLITADQHPSRYRAVELLALSEALRETLSVASAIRMARARVEQRPRFP
jgi:hypothetical protein